jgi:hypothetical protein
LAKAAMVELVLLVRLVVAAAAAALVRNAE